MIPVNLASLDAICTRLLADLDKMRQITPQDESVPSQEIEDITKEIETAIETLNRLNHNSKDPMAKEGRLEMILTSISLASNILGMVHIPMELDGLDGEGGQVLYGKDVQIIKEIGKTMSSPTSLPLPVKSEDTPPKNILRLTKVKPSLQDILPGAVTALPKVKELPKKKPPPAPPVEKKVVMVSSSGEGESSSEEEDDDDEFGKRKRKGKRR